VQFIRFALRCSLFLALFASASMAQSQRTFVSGGGSDGNPCRRTAPCRTFGTALTQTNPGGEIYYPGFRRIWAFRNNQGCIRNRSAGSGSRNLGLLR
jgi:hypothetical protein